MEWKKAIIEYLKRFLVLFLIQLIIYTIIDLWVPMKRMLSGDKMLFEEIMAYIQFKDHWPIIFAVSIGVSIRGFRGFLKNPAVQSDQRPVKKKG